MRLRGARYASIEQSGIYLPVVEAHADYRRPASYDELLKVTAWVQEIGRAQLQFSYLISRDGEELVRGYTRHAAVNGKGRPIRQAGPRLQNCFRLDWPYPVQGKDRLRGEVVYIDRFGNGITNLENQRIEHAKLKTFFLPGRRAIPSGSHYASVPLGQPVVVPGSSGQTLTS